MKKLLFILFSLIALAACDSNSKKSSGLLQNASGRAGEIIVVMDSAEWNGALGDAIKETFRAGIPWLPTEEYMYKLNQVDPQELNSVLKTVKNIIFAMTLDNNAPGSRVVRNYFTQGSIAKIKADTSLFVYTAKDEFAKGQTVMYLFGQDSSTLINQIKVHANQLRQHFQEAENQRLMTGLYKAKELTGLNNMLKKDHDCSMRIPLGYQLVVNESGFIWFRQINPESDKNIFINYTDYTSASIFEHDNIIKYRDSVAYRQLFEDPENLESYIKTETKVPFLPVTTREINFKENYAIETRGLWKTNNLSMGGPFLSYALANEKTGRLYYIEGFLFAPGRSQYELMRELEVILSTFDFK